MKATRRCILQGPCTQGSHRVQKTSHWLRVVLSGGLTAVLAACSTGGVTQTEKVQRAVGAVSFNDAARFLDQATFGATLTDIQRVQDVGYSAWLDEQFAMPMSNYPNVCCSGTVTGVSCFTIIPCPPGYFAWFSQTPPGNWGINPLCRIDNYSMWKLQNIFYANAVGKQNPPAEARPPAADQLHQRIMFALNQIIVTSGADPDVDMASRMTGYLRVLEENAFGNFRDLLRAMSLNPTMGRYLDNITNTVLEPNENYAREIMQLFSVGLFILNDDGTSTGIPTYDQQGVVELTRALTGWNYNAPLAAGVLNYKDPLVAVEDRHDTGDKTLFVGTPFEQTIPAGQTTEEDLDSAIDIIFNHPNVGTFIGRALIQMLVTSNPSGEYVQRVTQAFSGPPRGDMQAVIRAILLDPEARNENPGPDFGKLKEPV